MFISQRCASCCRSAVFQRARSRRRLPPVHRLPPRGDLWQEQTSRLQLRSSFTVDGKDVCLIAGDFSPNPVQHSTLPHCHSQLSDLSIRLYLTISLKYIRLDYWLLITQLSISGWITDDINPFTKMVTSLLPNVETGFSVLFNSVDQITWSIILRSDWSVTSQLTNTVTMTISM